MRNFVKQGIQNKEILDILRRDFPQYAWSITTLDRGLRHFAFYYIDAYVSVDEVHDAVFQEIDSPVNYWVIVRCIKNSDKNMI